MFAMAIMKAGDILLRLDDYPIAGADYPDSGPSRTPRSRELDWSSRSCAFLELLFLAETALAA